LHKLKAESSHILAWMVEGCMGWQRRDWYDLPATISEATGDSKTSKKLMQLWQLPFVFSLSCRMR
jgi:putative DNA primase/helicase